jgi:hypothetical protein
LKVEALACWKVQAKADRSESMALKEAFTKPT